MPGAPLSVADTLDLPGLACTAGAAATRTFGRRPDEVPVARRFIREALNGHPAAFDAELLACELVTNTVQHATDADWGVPPRARPHLRLVRARPRGLLASPDSR